MKGNTREKSKSQVSMDLKAIFRSFLLEPKTMEKHGKFLKQGNGMMCDRQLVLQAVTL